MCLCAYFHFVNIFQYFNQAMPSAIGGSIPVGVGNNAGNTVSNTGSGTTHSTTTSATGNTVKENHFQKQ